MSIKTREQIRAEREALDAQERELRASELNVVREKIATMASEDGMSFDSFIAANLTGTGNAKRKASAAKRDVKPKLYKHPSDSKLDWSGHGPRPAWVKALIGDKPLEALKAAMQAQQSNGQARA